MSEEKRCGNLIILSGPSGAGKSVLKDYALRTLPYVKFSISCTTRAPRGDEQDGVEYFFIAREKFEALAADGEFMEWAEVHGNYYGTSRSFIMESLRYGNDVILDIDVQGARAVKKACPEAVSVFVLPPSFDVLRERLLHRRLDDAGVIEKRLKIARDEIGQYENYDYLIINDDLENAEREFAAVIVSAGCRMSARRNAGVAIMKHF